MKLSIDNILRIIALIIGGAVIIHLCSLMGQVARSMMPSDEQKDRLVSTTAEVKQIDYTPGGIRRAQVMILKVDYTYDGTEYSASISGRKGTKTGDMIEIYIDPDDPSQAWLAGRSDTDDLFTVTAVIFLLSVPLAIFLTRMPSIENAASANIVSSSDESISA